jgi:hypothetical protein
MLLLLAHWPLFDIFPFSANVCPLSPQPHLMHHANLT